jgi:hypothetical protein
LENANSIFDKSHHGLPSEAVYQFQDSDSDMMDMPIVGMKQSVNDRVPDSTLSRYRVLHAKLLCSLTQPCNPLRVRIAIIKAVEPPNRYAVACLWN